MMQQRCISGLVADFPDSERELLEPQGILAILVIPFQVSGEFRGLLALTSARSRVSGRSLRSTS